MSIWYRYKSKTKLDKIQAYRRTTLILNDEKANKWTDVYIYSEWITIDVKYSEFDAIMKNNDN